MAENKTKKTDQPVENFLNSISDEQKRQDSYKVLEIMKEITGESPKMWGESIIGFGDYHYKYATGREGDWMIIGFSPRKQNLTLYLTYGFEENTDLISRLGKHKLGKACLYIKRIDDVDVNILKQLIERSYKSMKKSS